MKKLFIVLLSVTLLTNAQAQKEKEKLPFVKEKSMSKTYPASGNKLSITNSFGNVKFIASDKNEIRIDIHMEAASTHEELAQSILDAITISEKQDGNSIVYKTSIKDSKQNCKDCKTNMHIDYEVQLPVSVELSVTNSFGGITLPNYTGPVSIDNKFGNFEAGSISNLKELGIEFGKADIKNIADLDATFKFSTVNIDKLSGKNKIRLEFCENVKISLDNAISSLNLEESYSTVNIKPAASLNASYSVFTSFGSFIDRSSSDIKRVDTPVRYGADQNKTYRGGSGSVKIDIRSSFGKIIIGDATTEDMKKETGKANKQKKVI